MPIRKEINPRELDEYISTSYEANLLIAKEINKIVYLQKMKPLMVELAKELLRAGVDFSNATCP